ncbi:hypothetical protein PF005_g9381 [Phytophthora fragariae]|uniref:Uncharacterized protein n=1 Tax=Phytophthora fragariae TaxID=53985 RepID=A0A6A3YC92_9STRA|nr:hypothetical protein PF007_g9270 [Phytophthora fragariae]KAE9215571.1 hypothetical protein PF005_g9381 [Phytophthora fragariae]
MQLQFLILALAALATATQATPLTIQNQCAESIALYDNSATETIASGGSTTRTLSSGFNGMFRNSANAQATLAEFSITGGYTWYDISIIPTGSSGPGNCASLEECKEVTGGTGFNTPVQIAPSGCTTVTCLEDGCADAYQYPSDDDKTHSGSLSGNTIIFPPEDNRTEQAAAATTTSTKSTASKPTSAGSNDQTATTESASSSTTPVGAIVAATVGAIAVVGAIAAIVVARRKKQQMEAASPKDDLEWLENFSGIVTPVQRIPTM